MSQQATKFIENAAVTLVKLVSLGSKGTLITYGTGNTTLAVGTNGQYSELG